MLLVWIFKEERLLVILRDWTSNKRCCWLLWDLDVIIHFDVRELVLHCLEMVFWGWDYSFDGSSIHWMRKSCAYGLFWIYCDEFCWVPWRLMQEVNWFLWRVLELFYISRLSLVTIRLSSVTLEKLFIENSWWVGSSAIIVTWVYIVVVSLFALRAFIKELLRWALAWLATVPGVIKDLGVSGWEWNVVGSILIPGTCIWASAFVAFILLCSYFLLFDDRVRTSASFEVCVIIVFMQRITDD